jgi:hypothetical protein
MRKPNEAIRSAVVILGIGYVVWQQALFAWTHCYYSRVKHTREHPIAQCYLVSTWKFDS